jgi:hypothetical protein
MQTKEDKKIIDRFRQLPVNYWDFREDDTKEFTHGIHNYPATMVCPISRNIIKLVKDVQPVHALFDPFAGSGTVLVEGTLAGIEVVAGNDINPLALLLSKVKTTPIEGSVLKRECDALFARISLAIQNHQSILESVDDYMSNTLCLDLTDKKGWGDEAPKYLRQFCIDNEFDVSIPDSKNLGYWFRPRVILELALIKAEIENVTDTDIRDFIFVAFSETIRYVSNRRNGEFKMYRMPVAKVLNFNPLPHQEFKKILSRNISKMSSFYSELIQLDIKPNVTVFENDTCSLDDVPDNTYDLVITSPPYGDSRTTVAYGEYSRLSLQWINRPELTEKEIMSIDKSLMGGQKKRNGFEFTLQSPTLRDSLDRIMAVDVERAGEVYSFYNDLDASISSISKKTCHGGYQFWVVGNRTVKNELLQTDVIIAELAVHHGLTAVYSVDRNIPNKVMPLQNSPTNITGRKSSTIVMEHIVILRKN